MPSLLTKLIHDARAFLTDLARNNSRDWFTAHKADYDDKLKAPALQLLDEMTGPLGRLSGVAIDTKLFRPHRDVRFSKDKTPYNTHLHLAWMPAYSGPAKPAYFFGVSPDYITIGAGQMDFDKPAMAAWRNRVDTNGTPVAEIMNALTSSGYRISEPAYKRVPAPYARDHPQEALLRRKGLSAWRDSDAALTRDQMHLCFEALTPVVKTLADLKP
ncbi:MAG: TIGR02453 family protein [Pseudomonadota bacterium]